MSVDFPAPLWPTRPTHSPAPMWKSTPSSARTAPKCFSAPTSLTMSALAVGMPSDIRLARRLAMIVPCSLDIGFDGGDGIFLRVFVAGDTALDDFRQLGLEVVLGEGEIRHQQVMRD